MAAPAEIQQRSSTFANSLGESMHYSHWLARGNGKGTVVVVHGLNSHGGYYINFANMLAVNHYDVYVLDLRGHGLSDGDRGCLYDYGMIILDIDQLVDIARSDSQLLPLFLFGHGAGAVLAAAYGAAHQQKLHGLICGSPTLEWLAPSLKLKMIKRFAGNFPQFGAVKLNNQDFSRDKQVLELMENDFLLEGEAQPAITIQQLVFASEYLKRKMAILKTPLLILHGTSDKICRYQGSNYFFDHVGAVDKQLKLYPEHYHDLLNDIQHEIVAKDILRWLDNRAWDDQASAINIEIDWDPGIVSIVGRLKQVIALN